MLLEIGICNLTNHLTYFVHFFWHKENQDKQHDNYLRIQ